MAPDALPSHPAPVRTHLQQPPRPAPRRSRVARPPAAKNSTSESSVTAHSWPAAAAEVSSQSSVGPWVSASDRAARVDPARRSPAVTRSTKGAFARRSRAVRRVVVGHEHALLGMMTCERREDEGNHIASVAGRAHCSDVAGHRAGGVDSGPAARRTGLGRTRRRSLVPNRAAYHSSTWPHTPR